MKRAAPTFVTMVPGIRLAGASIDDQSRIATPGEAIRMGSDVIIAVRTVHNAPDPAAAAQQVYEEAEAGAAALAARRRRRRGGGAPGRG